MLEGGGDLSKILTSKKLFANLQIIYITWGKGTEVPKLLTYTCKVNFVNFPIKIVNVHPKLSYSQKRGYSS